MRKVFSFINHSTNNIVLELTLWVIVVILPVSTRNLSKNLMTFQDCCKFAGNCCWYCCGVFEIVEIVQRFVCVSCEKYKKYESITMKLLMLLLLLCALKFLVITASFRISWQEMVLFCSVFLHKSRILRIWIGAIYLIVVKRKKSLLWIFECILFFIPQGLPKHRWVWGLTRNLYISLLYREYCDKTQLFHNTSYILLFVIKKEYYNSKIIKIISTFIT